MMDPEASLLLNTFFATKTMALCCVELLRDGKLASCSGEFMRWLWRSVSVNRERAPAAVQSFATEVLGAYFTHEGNWAQASCAMEAQLRALVPDEAECNRLIELARELVEREMLPQFREGARE